MPAIVYLIPSPLDDDSLSGLPSYVLDAILSCGAFFVENERTTRRFFKKWHKEMNIDAYEWFTIGDKANEEVSASFRNKINKGITVGIVSEAGCPGIADPGQELVSIAHQLNATINPLVGPSSILLALMASGMNGQRFQFLGYLPVQQQERKKMIAEIETYSAKNKCTQVFIETPYRNAALFEALVQTCKPSTLLCIAAELTSHAQWIKTKPVSEWKKEIPELHKKPVLFLLLAE